MSETCGHDTLKRMARAGREGHEARMTSPSKALRQAIGRAAEAEFELALNVRGVQSETLLPEGMLRSVDDDMLLMILDGPRGALGAVALDGPVVAGMIEKQTMGRVTEKVGAERVPTATDAAMVAPFVDLTLKKMGEALGHEADFCAGFQFGARIESRRHIELLIDAAELHMMRAQLELEGGSKRGEFVIILPTLEARARIEAKGEAAQTDETDNASTGQGRQFADGAFMQAQANMRAVIWRQKMTLSAFSELQIGDRIDLSPHAIEEIYLDAGTGSEKMGPCKLGQHDGLRAVRLSFVTQSTGMAGAVDGVPEEPLGDLGSPAMDQPEALSLSGADAAKGALKIEGLADMSQFESPETGADPELAALLTEPVEPKGGLAETERPDFGLDHLVDMGGGLEGLDLRAQGIDMPIQPLATAPKKATDPEGMDEDMPLKTAM